VVCLAVGLPVTVMILQKRLNGSRCRLGCRLGWAQDAGWDAESHGPRVPCIRWKADGLTGRGTFRGVYDPLQSIVFGGLGKTVNCAKTVGPILMIYTSQDVLLCKEVPFGDRDETAPHLRGIITQHLHFGGVNRRFRAKLVKYQHLHIIEATASIPTKFCTSIKTPPNTLCGLSKHAHITNPRWRKVAIMKISKNRHISMDRLPRNFAK